MKRENRQRRARERGSGRGLSSAYLDGEESDDGNGVSLAAIKNSYKKGIRGQLLNTFIFLSCFNCVFQL